MKKKILTLFVCLLLVSGCGHVKLANGENAIVTFDEGAISSDDLYKELKNQYGGQVLTDLVDKYLLDKKYDETTEEKNYVKQTIKTLKESAEDAGTTLETYISAYYGLKDEEALRKYLSLNYKRNLWVEDYAKETVTDKQIEEYYESYVYGDIDGSQILITIDTSDDASDDEKTAAENDALDTAKSIIEKLNNGEDFAELAKEYSKDQATSSNGGAFTNKVNDGDLADEALAALRNLENGSYTTSPVKSSYGYHILYKVSQDEKPELDDELKETIRTKIGSELSQESGFSTVALRALREQNNMKFEDSELESEFESLN